MVAFFVLVLALIQALEIAIQMFQLTSLRLVVGLMPGRSFFHADSTGGRIVPSEHEFQARPKV